MYFISSRFYKSLLTRNLICWLLRYVFVCSSAQPLLAQGGSASWFPFRPEDDFSPSVIDAGSWLDAPAGKHGFVQIAGEDFKFEDGTPVKFWGVNIANDWPFAPNAEARQWAQYLAKYGVNGVRFHKFTKPGLTGPTSVHLDPALFDSLDYFSGQLRQRGIYYGWSHIYGHKPRPGDRDKLLAYEEIVDAGGAHLKGSTIGLVNFAPDLQELSIGLTVNMLNHRNPYTGLRYAEDPALSFVELQNEDNIFFATTLNWVEACPTYKKLFCEQFSDWLKKKYASHANLVAAWGAEAIDAFPKYQTGEHLDKRNILPMAHHGYLSRKTMDNPLTRRRLLDTARFLYETQNAFYQKYIRAIRATGYKGPIVGSCWQAGDDVAHYYNLHADYLAGIIDRHNYFGGGAGGHHLDTGKVDSQAMVSRPGSGLLSTGLQAVADRPFVLSEWMSMAPNQWTAESTPLIAVYGMGLQGWDGSYAYGSNQVGIAPTLQSPRHGVYNVDSPLHISLYPALSRMVYRNDIQTGVTVFERNVFVPDLAEGKIGFSQTVNQDADVKKFGDSVQELALTAGQVVVNFTQQPEKTRAPDLSPYLDTSAQVVRSSTGQLAWDYSGKGFCTLNTPATKGVIGFAGGKQHQLGEVTLWVETPFAIVLVNSLDKDKPIAQSNHLLLTTIARARNTGMEYSADGSRLLQVGSAPILLEPVKATLTIAHPGKPVVHVLDHAGRRTGKKIRAKGNRLVLDGTTHQAIYYEVEYTGAR